MKGKLSYDKWTVYHTYGQSYNAERIVDGEPELVHIKAHCLACAKADVLTKWGGKVDLRGNHKQGFCGSFLIAMQVGVDSEQTD